MFFLIIIIKIKYLIFNINIYSIIINKYNDKLKLIIYFVFMIKIIYEISFDYIILFINFLYIKNIYNKNQI